MIPGRGTKISHASGPKNQNIKKQKQYNNEFHKNFKNGPHKKSLIKKRHPSVLLGHHQQPQSPSPHSPLKVVLFHSGTDNFASLVVLLPRIRLPSFLCLLPSSLKDTYLSPPPPPRVSLISLSLPKPRQGKGIVFKRPSFPVCLVGLTLSLLACGNRRGEPKEDKTHQICQ